MRSRHRSACGFESGAGGVPVRIGNPRPPPVAVGIEFLPEQPDFARTIGEQVLAREAHRNREPLRAFADQHDVAGVFHHGLRHHRDILDVAHAADRTGAARRTVHAAGIEFDDAFFVGQAAKADGIVVGIVLRALHHADRGIERVAAALQERVGFFDIGVTVVRADDDGAFCEDILAA